MEQTVDKLYKVVMLPTKEKAKPGMIHGYVNFGKEYLLARVDLDNVNDWNKLNRKDKLFHLYILSDEEPKEGDWAYDIMPNEEGVKQHSIYIKKKGVQYMDTSTERKIIASTDKSLIVDTPNGTVSGKHTLHTDLPQPSDAFIQRFIEEHNKGNVIEEVMVEFEVDYSVNCEEEISMCINEIGNKIGCEGCRHVSLKLKISKDNTITIKEIKDSWTKEEIQQFFANVETHGCHEYTERDIFIHAKDIEKYFGIKIN
jgi:hypothetical protein